MTDKNHFPADLEAILADYADEVRRGSRTQAAEAVSRLSDLFVGKEAWQGGYADDSELRGAYLEYFLPANLPKIHVPLAAWLAAVPHRLSGRPVRVLDLGSGPGTALLGFVDFVRRLEPSSRPAALELVAIDDSGESLRDATRLLERFAAGDPAIPPLRFSAIRADLVAERASLFPLATAEGRFDLMIAMNALTEVVRAAPDGFEAAVRLVESALRDAGKEDAAIVLVEPGLRETSRDLHRLRDRLLTDSSLEVVAPCLHRAPCPALTTTRDWCIADLAWQAPARVAEIDRRTGLRKDSLKFSYLVLAHSRSAPAAAGVWRVVSDVLDLKGERRVYLCGEGRWIVAGDLKRHQGAASHAFARLRRGDLVAIAGLEARGTVHRLGPGATVRRLLPDGSPIDG